jgi:hypothetical protein
VMLISKSLSSFFNFILSFSLVETLKEHMIFNKVLKTRKNEKMGKPKQQKTTHGSPPPQKHWLATWNFDF